jgi:hypothetical protein
LQPDIKPGSLEYYEQLALADETSTEVQVQTLQRAVAASQLTFEDYAQAVTLSLECIDEAGVAVLGPELDESAGYPRLHYGFAAGVNAAGSTDNPVPDECIRANSFYIEMAYTSQPASQEALDAILESKRPAVEQCIDKAGIVVDGDLPVREWLLEIVASGETGVLCVHAEEIMEF